jgi:SAM-dependent methyltransferase
MDQLQEPNRYRATVPFYAYRVSYPEPLLQRIWNELGMKPGDGALDLGCGPATLAIPLARRGAKVTALDPEPGMIAAAREAVREAGVAVDIRQASSFAMPVGLGPFKLVAMGRSFHWTDRAQTARTLDPLVVPGGALVSLGDTVIRSAETAWRDEWLRIMDEFGGSMREMRLVNGVFHADEAILLLSPFSKVERISTILRREIDVDEVLGRSYSMSRTSKERLGAKLDAFEATMREMFARHQHNGRVVEISEIYAVIARRP